MRIMIDTNVLISAVLNHNSTPHKAYIKATLYPNSGIVCKQNIDELRRTFNRKFPSYRSDFEEFISKSLPVLEIVPIPEIEAENEGKIRDVKDKPIFRAAVNAGADIILTGDKDFLEADIDHPMACTPADFLNMRC